MWVNVDDNPCFSWSWIVWDWLGNWQRVMAAAFLSVVAIGGVVAILDTVRRPKEPSEADVQRAADLYREYYKHRALDVIGDHMLAAKFAPTGEHHRFLRRVCQELQRDL